MLAGIDTADLLNCEESPYISSFGNFFVYSYTPITNSWDFCQTIKSSNVLDFIVINSRCNSLPTVYYLLSTVYSRALGMMEENVIKGFKEIGDIRQDRVLLVFLKILTFGSPYLLDH